MTVGSTSLRVVLGLVGAVALIAGGLGTYLSLNRGDGLPATTAVQAQKADGFALTLHAAPRVLPALSFADGNGRPLGLADFRGRTVLLNVWATWCPPCREEMPSLDRLQQSLGGHDFEIVALSVDAGGAAAVKRFYKEIGVGRLAVYVDPAMRAPVELRAPGLPTTLLIDADGRELGRHVGPARWDDPQTIRQISGHLRR